MSSSAIPVTQTYRYGEMTWPMIRDAARAGRVAVLPVATIEDHGHHLPVDTDVVLCTTVCERGAALAAADCVLVPPVGHGYSPHHMDFPGTLSIDSQTFTDYLVNITTSLAHHGFNRILLVNGHGSNTAFCEIASRLTVIATEGRALAMAVNHWGINAVRAVAGDIRDSPLGGMSHACELETSMYLAIRPELVDMSQAVDESQDLYATSNIPANRDLVAGLTPGSSQVSFWPYWSSISRTGVRGDATKATAEKGELLLAAAATGLAELIRELRALQIQDRVDHH